MNRFSQQHIGLSSIDSVYLKQLLKLVYQNKIECPFSRTVLLNMGLNAVAESGDILFGLSKQGVRAVLVSVLAERG